MSPEDRATARRQLDKRLSLLSNADMFARPPRGWIKAIREALGMTTAQLAKRLGVSQPRAVAIEKAEVQGAITLDSLERAAQALNCRLVYVLVPQKPLEALVTDRAEQVAQRRLQSARHTMTLEAQTVESADEQVQFKSLVHQLVMKAGSSLWDEDA